MDAESVDLSTDGLGGAFLPGSPELEPPSGPRGGAFMGDTVEDEEGQSVVEPEQTRALSDPAEGPPEFGGAYFSGTEDA